MGLVDGAQRLIPEATARRWNATGAIERRRGLAYTAARRGAISRAGLFVWSLPMKILAGLIASCLVAMPLYAQSDTPADTGKPAEGAPPSPEPPAGTADDAGKPAATTPEPEEAPEGATPEKPAEPPEA